MDDRSTVAAMVDQSMADAVGKRFNGRQAAS